MTFRYLTFVCIQDFGKYSTVIYDVIAKSINGIIIILSIMCLCSPQCWHSSSVCLSVYICHTLVLCQDDNIFWSFFTTCCPNLARFLWTKSR